jgi:hypothetical protein
MPWKPEVHVEGKWYANGITFETRPEAAEYAKDLFYRWTSTADHRAVESDAVPNYRYVDGELEIITDG